MISNATFSYDNNGKLKAEGETSHMTYMGIKNNKTMENKLNSFIKYFFAAGAVIFQNNIN